MGSASLLTAVTRRLEGKVALITGAASGIGMSAAKLFAHHGARLVIADIQDDKGEALCRALGPSVASYVHCDVTDESDVKEAVDTTVSRHGKLDVMLNNAGTFGDPNRGLVQSERSDFDRVIATIVVGNYLGTKHAGRVMIPARRGSIVIMGSATSVVAHPISPTAYTCSKHAVVGIMRSAALELGQYGVRVNCVSPALLPTPMMAKALGMEEKEVEDFMEERAVLKGVRLKAEDVAEAALYLASDESRYVNGLNLLIDGGYTVA